LYSRCPSPWFIHCSSSLIVQFIGIKNYNMLYTKNWL
jgi:hypothetical protein